MNHREAEAFSAVAGEITEWQAAAQQFPLDELCQMAMDCQHGLAASLNAFNDICQDPDDGGLPSAEAMRAIGGVTRMATAMAIFYLGIAIRTSAHLTAQQN
jgi:hypothetical protein